MLVASCRNDGLDLHGRGCCRRRRLPGRSIRQRKRLGDLFWRWVVRSIRQRRKLDEEAGTLHFHLRRGPRTFDCVETRANTK